MLGFSTKKKEAKKIIDESQEESREEREVRERKEKIDKEIIVHTMPGKFRQEHRAIGKSKKVGIIILATGGFVMAALIVFFYLYLFRSPQAKDAAPAPAKEIDQSTAEEKPFLKKEPEDKALAKLETGEEKKAATSTELGQEAATTTDAEAVATTTSPIEEDKEKDSDNDGFLDIEEELLGTKINSSDSDGDGYSDLVEVMNLYDPSGSGRLKDNPNIITYKSSEYNYAMLYPSKWKRNNVDGDKSVILNSEDNHFFHIAVEENTNFESINEWYMRQFELQSIDIYNVIQTDTWSGVRSDEGLAVYLTDKERRYIYVLSYTPNLDEKEIYGNIFEMMINSLVIE